MNKKFKLDENSIIIPKGTDVVLKYNQKGEDGYTVKAGSVARVTGVYYNTYELVLPTGRKITCQREQIVIQKKEVLEHLGRCHFDWLELKREIIYEAIVGSRAWGLSDENSDIDKKGIFVLPFSAMATIYSVPDEIRDPESDSQYWEIQKAIYQGLRADANTLETLWSPLITKQDSLGLELVKKRRVFVSGNIYGSFGRYAMSQFKKIQQKLSRFKLQEEAIKLIEKNPDLNLEQLAETICEKGFVSGKGAFGQAKELIIDLYQSLYDRGLIPERGFEILRSYLLSSSSEIMPARKYRPKNAYNLIRLLYSGINWMIEGEPLVEVKGKIKEELLLIKKGEIPIEATIKKAYELAEEFEKAYEKTSLPAEPDYDGADDLLRLCREHSAIRFCKNFNK